MRAVSRCLFVAEVAMVQCEKLGVSPAASHKVTRAMVGPCEFDRCAEKLDADRDKVVVTSETPRYASSGLDMRCEMEMI